MGDLLDVLRAGIAFADSFTQQHRLQSTVVHQSASSGGGAGEVTLGTPVPRLALVEWKQEEIRDEGGEATKSRAIVTFLDPNVVVTMEDVITLADGTTGPILAIEGPKAQTGMLLRQVYLG